MITDASTGNASLGEIGLPEDRREPGTDLLQMGRRRRFHVDLDLAVLRVHIVEELFARPAGIRFDLAVQILADANDLC